MAPATVATPGMTASVGAGAPTPVTVAVAQAPPGSQAVYWKVSSPEKPGSGVYVIVGIVEAAWFGTEPAGEEAEAAGEAPLGMLVVTWLAALANVWFGLVTRVPRELSANAATILLGHLP